MAEYPNVMDPKRYRDTYNVSRFTTGNYQSTQGVFAALNQYFSPSDLQSLQVEYALPRLGQPVTASYGNHSSDAKCIADRNNCGEGNLDVQYIMTMSPRSPTTYWYTDNYFDSWLLEIANTKKPPLVLSISYGSQEILVPTITLDAFNVQAIKLGSMGVTIVAASGDSGSNTGDIADRGPSACSYAPSFPGSNPYVISVGATQVSL